MGNKRYKVLMIEDDKLDQMAFERLVETQKLQYDYTIADSVSQAQNILACQQFDIIISDHLMGDGTAFDILDLVKNTPIIVVTGTGNEEIAVKAWRAGAYDYLTKDIERNYLKALPITVENAIRHKKAEENLRLLSGAIMSSVDSVYITDIDDRISFVNKAFCDTYGYKKEEILGKDCGILWLEGTKTANTRAVFRTQGIGSTWEIGFYHRRKDGSIFPVSLSRSIIKDSSGNKMAVVGTARDITERILVEDELRKTILKLEEQIQLKSELVVKVSEALKRLLSDEKMLHGRAQEKNVWKKLDMARKIISDLFDMSQIDAGKAKLQMTKLNLRDIVSEVLDDLLPFAEKKNIELRNIMPDSELIISADRDRIKQVLTNFISNSINSVSVEGHIEVRLKDIGSEVTIEIQDNGQSIESSKMDKIFNGSEWMREQPGICPEEDSPLGLMVAKKIVEMHGGYILVESTNESCGNTFCISLPKSNVKEKVSIAAREVEIRS